MHGKYKRMKTFFRNIRYVGVIVLLIGVLVLIIPYFLTISSNTTLLVGLLLVIAGFILHIIIDKWNT